MPRRSPSPAAPSQAPPSMLRRALLILGAVLVQSFMLLQVSYFYLRLRWRQTVATAAVLKEEREDSALSRAPTISVIVMVRNEEEAIRATYRTLAARARHRGLIEVVVVDSGCTDSTMDAARGEAAARPEIATVLVTAPAPGRGAALDAGCGAATGEIVFVCHADCIVPQDWDELIRQGLAQPGVLATAFKFQLNREELPAAEGGLPGGGVMEFTVNLRATWLQLPFGDQGLALPAKRLARYGGWGGRDYPLLEDFQLVQKLRVAGAQGRGRIAEIGTAKNTLRCSPRRWRRLGVYRINLVNQLVMLWSQKGGTPQQLFDFYYGISTDHVPRWLAVLTAPLMPEGHGSQQRKKAA